MRVLDSASSKYIITHVHDDREVVYYYYYYHYIIIREHKYRRLT